MVSIFSEIPVMFLTACVTWRVIGNFVGSITSFGSFSEHCVICPTAIEIWYSLKERIFAKNQTLPAPIHLCLCQTGRFVKASNIIIDIKYNIQYIIYYIIYYIILYYIILYYIILYYIILYYIILYYAKLYYIMLYYIMLYYIIICQYIITYSRLLRNNPIITQEIIPKLTSARYLCS